MSFQQIARLVLMSAVVLVPQVAWAQAAASGSIAGTVRDTSGAVVPGVTVEAASPALIEKVRAVVSDGQGEYKIVDLRPGTYTVTFTLPGFNTFRREGIELTIGFTAAVNGEMRVGALEETVTVTGASPVVDTQNVRSQTVLSRQVLDALPTNRTIQAFAALTVGVSVTGASVSGQSMQDVGGNKGEQYGTIMIHGSRVNDGRLHFDGMRFNSSLGAGAGQSRFWAIDQAAVQEVAIETGGMSAEAETGGVYQNSVPKDGGNVFSAYFFGTGANGSMQSDNLTDKLRGRGLTSVSTIKKTYDVGGGVGGPIKRDQLWFYGARRVWGSQEYTAGNFFNKTHGSPVYTPDLDRQAFTDYPFSDYSLRLTLQPTSKHKFTAYYSNQRNCQCQHAVDAGAQSPEASIDFRFVPNYMAIGTWTYPATNRILFEAGAARLYNILQGTRTTGVTPNHIPITDLNRGYTYNAANSGNATTSYVDAGTGVDLSQHNERFAVSYITGSHAFKVGLQTLWGVQNIESVRVNNQGLQYQFRNGLPSQLVQWATPNNARQGTRSFALFAQDQWTVKRMTLNLGARFDQIKGTVPAQERVATLYTPAFHIDRVDNVPNFTDLTARLGVAYDLFGNGKTAIKASLGRYLGAVGPGTAFSQNPANTLVQSAARTWGDANGNFIPDCDLKNFGLNGECGALNNRAFGTIKPNTRFAPDVLEGFGNREYNWQTSVSVQHELRPGIGLKVGYFRTWFGNFLSTDNVLVTPADFDTFCVTAPVDARLPGGGGHQVCGLGDVKPAKFGLVDNVVTKSSNFGDRKEVYNGVDATFSARFGDGGLLQGGTNVGRTSTTCVVVDAPIQFCNDAPPFRPEFKFSGVYPLPLWGLQASATFQNIPGTPIGFFASAANGAAVPGATVVSSVFTSAQIKPTLGRDLSQGPRGVATVILTEPNTWWEDRINQLDIRFTKTARLGAKARVKGNFDIYNILNADTILADITRYGASFLRPSSVLGARVFKFSGQFDY